MKNCLTDYVGLRGCGSDTAPSGVYINDYAGVSVEALDKAADSDKVHYRKLWDAIQSRAYLRLLSDFRGHIYRKRTVNDNYDSGIFGIAKPGQSIDIDPTLRRGLRLRVEESRFLVLDILGIFVNYPYGDTPTGCRLVIADTRTGEEFYRSPEELPMPSGLSSVFVQTDLRLTSERQEIDVLVYVDIDLTTATPPLRFTSVRDTLYDGEHPTVGGGCAERSMYDGRFWPSGFSQVTPGASTLENIATEGESYGLAADYVLRCDVDIFLCRHKARLLDTWVNLCAAEFAVERLQSPRVNLFTSKNRDEIRDLASHYEKRYLKALESAVAHLDPPTDYCFPCNEPVQQRWLRP